MREKGRLHVPEMLRGALERPVAFWRALSHGHNALQCFEVLPEALHTSGIKLVRSLQCSRALQCHVHSVILQARERKSSVCFGVHLRCSSMFRSVQAACSAQVGAALNFSNPQKNNYRILQSTTSMPHAEAPPASSYPDSGRHNVLQLKPVSKPQSSTISCPRPFGGERGNTQPTPRALCLPLAGRVLVPTMSTWKCRRQEGRSRGPIGKAKLAMLRAIAYRDGGVRRQCPARPS